MFFPALSTAPYRFDKRKLSIELLYRTEESMSTRQQFPQLVENCETCVHVQYLHNDVIDVHKSIYVRTAQILNHPIKMIILPKLLSYLFNLEKLRTLS